MSDRMNDETKGVGVVVYRDAPAQTFDAALATMLADQTLTAEKMEIVMRVRRELLSDRARESFQIAYAAMAQELPQVEKDGMVDLRDKGSYRYARWEDMDTVIRPILAKHGFSLMFQEYVTDKGVPMMRAKLMHIDGHFEISERQIRQDKGPGRNDEQAWGSGTTYAKRYLAENLTNTVRKGVDDDATGTARAALLTETEADDLYELLMQTLPEGRNIGEYTQSFLSRMLTGVEKIADVPRHDYARLKNALEERKGRK